MFILLDKNQDKYRECDCNMIVCVWWTSLEEYTQFLSLNDGIPGGLGGCFVFCYFQFSTVKIHSNIPFKNNSIRIKEIHELWFASEKENTVI